MNSDLTNVKVGTPVRLNPEKAAGYRRRFDLSLADIGIVTSVVGGVHVTWDGGFQDVYPAVAKSDYLVIDSIRFEVILLDQ